MKRGLLSLSFVEELSGTILIEGSLDLCLLLHTSEHLILILQTLLGKQILITFRITIFVLFLLILDQIDFNFSVLDAEG